MTPAETLHLCRLVKAICPQQLVDEFTPDAWHGLLDDLRLADCLEAAKALGKRQHFIDPADIRAEVRRLREKRIADAGPVPIPDGLDPDDTTRYATWLLHARRRIADGEPPPTWAELPTREMPEVAELLPKPPDISRHMAALRQAHRNAKETTP